VSLPSLSSSSSSVVVTMSLAQTTRLLASSSEATRFSVFVNRVDDPVDSRISSNSLVRRINEDNLEVLVRRILIDPVRVKNSQVGASSTDSFFCGGAEGSLVLQLIDTLVGRLAIGSTFTCRPLSATSSDTDSIDDIALLGLVSQSSCLIWSGWSRSAVNDIQLSELPAANSK